MQVQNFWREEQEQQREALRDVANRSRVRKHTVFINGKEKVAFLEKIAQNKLSEIKEPELIFIFNGKHNQRDLLNA